MLSVRPSPAYRLLTVADYRALPDAGPRYQLIRGTLVMAPAPNRFHQQVVTNLVLLLGSWIRERSLGKLYVAPFDVQLTEIDVYQPDLAYFSNERLHFLTDAGANGAPDLVVEVLSPRTEQIDREVKREIYARTAVREYWLVDPATQRVEVFHLRDDPSAPAHTLAPEDTLTSPLFEGLAVPVSEVFED